MKKQKLSIISTILGVLLICFMASCSEVNITMPLGPKGDRGKSSYEVWKEEVINGGINWPKDQITVTDYFMFLKGKDGKDGKNAYEVWKDQIAEGNVPDPHNPGYMWSPENNTLAHFWKFLTGASGENGKTPHIGANGNWWIGDIDTGQPARGENGKDGKDAQAPIVTIGANGNWFIDGVDTGKPARGKDGKDGKDVTITIGANGNWFIDGVDTGKPARGKDGKSPEVAIGQNGNWYINGADTGIPAFGKDGKDGKSAYEMWKEEASKGTLPHPHKPGEMWDKNKVSPADFWEYLRGANGKDGKSAYELWKEAVLDGTITDWPRTEVTLIDFFKYLKGKNGKDGQSAYEVWKEQITTGTVPDPHNPGSTWPPSKNTLADFWKFLTGATGENGQTPHIGANGNWFIGTHDTGVPARGKDGKDGKDAVPPTVTIGANGNWFIDGVDTGKPARGENGKDGHNPEITIGTNGNWFIDGVDTNKPAVGKDGKSPEVIIGNNGNWYINGVDTGKRAYAKNGKDGQDGKSAYALWKEEVDAGCAGTGPKVKHPHDESEDWPCSSTSQTNFWQYLSGKDGTSSAIEVVQGKFNVIPQFYDVKAGEYVSPVDGSVKFKIFDKDGNPAPAGSKAKGLPGVTDQNREFVADSNGEFIVPKELLPERLAESKRYGETTAVTINGVTEKSANNTLVPNKIHTRIIIKGALLQGNGSRWSIYASNYWTAINYLYEREVNGKWSAYPLELLPLPKMGLAKVKDINQPLTAPNVEYDAALETKWLKTPAPEPIILNQAYIMRPQILREGELATLASDAFFRKVMWDNKDNYWALVGLQHFYGEVPVSTTAVHNPEMNPFPRMRDGVKYDILQGVTILWGELRTEDLSYYYDRDLVLVGNLWKATKHQASELQADFRMRVGSVVNKGGSDIDASSAVYRTKKRFELRGVYDKAKIYTFGHDNFYPTPHGFWHYRAVIWYDFIQEADGKWYLINVIDKSKMEVQRGTMPPNYLN